MEIKSRDGGLMLVAFCKLVLAAFVLIVIEVELGADKIEPATNAICFSLLLAGFIAHKGD